MTKRTANEIYEANVGSAYSDITDDELDDTNLMAQVDELMLRCETCDWWCDADEIDEEGDCRDCRWP